MTNEEIEVVKETGRCHESYLTWVPTDESEFVDGVETVKKRLVATCRTCFQTFKKSRPDPIDLDQV